MIGNLFAIIAAALPLMGSPGPATISLASLGAAFGFRNCVPYLFGIILGTIAVLLVVAAGVAGLLSSRSGLLLPVQIAASVYILFLAWKIATAPVGRKATSNAKQSGVAVASFLPGLGLAIANPKAFAVIGAVYAGYSVAPGELFLDALLKVAALAGVAVAVNTAWLAFGSTLSRFLSDPIIGRAINIAFAVVLLISVGMALMTG